jgi:hypothetical protein
MSGAPGRFWVIRHPASGSPKKTVAQFDTAGDTEIPDNIAEHEDFKIQKVRGRSALVDSPDQSGLSDEERELLSQVYPVQS